MKRQSGITTRLMKRAPEGAIFVWCRGDTSYAQALANSLGRDDLEIVGPGYIEQGRYRGIKDLQIVLDHYTQLSKPAYDQLRVYWARYEQNLLAESD